MHHADLAFAAGDDGHAQHAVGAVAGVAVDLLVEARVGVDVGQVDHLAVAEALAGQPGIGGKADAFGGDAAGHAGIEFLGGGIIEKQRAAVGEQRGRRRHDLFQQRIEMDFRDDGNADFEQHRLLALLAFDFLEQAGVLEGRRSLQRQAFEQALVLGVEIAGELVQHLGDADHLALLVAYRHAEDVAGLVTGLAVDLLVETRVGIGVADDFRFAAREYRAGDAEMAGETDLAHGVALQHAREQLAGFGIVEEERAAVCVQRFGHHLHQAREQQCRPAPWSGAAFR